MIEETTGPSLFITLVEAAVGISKNCRGQILSQETRNAEFHILAILHSGCTHNTTLETL
jgi:hypothetical protein